jgi:hypothetical protein
VTPEERDDLKIQRGVLQQEVDYRRARRSAIFTWASSLLVAITGGVVALQVQGDQPLQPSQKVVLSVASIILGGYAALWWDDHRRQGKFARGKVKAIEAELGIQFDQMPSLRSDLIGGLLAILLLTVTALVTIWLPLSGVAD